MPWWGWLLTALGSVLVILLLWFGIFVYLMSKGDSE